jgi:hypothetical protein
LALAAPVATLLAMSVALAAVAPATTAVTTTSPAFAVLGRRRCARVALRYGG